jgi:CheY-specific phosphatase CheX
MSFGFYGDVEGTLSINLDAESGLRLAEAVSGLEVYSDWRKTELCLVEFGKMVAANVCNSVKTLGVHCEASTPHVGMPMPRPEFQIGSHVSETVITVPGVGALQLQMNILRDRGENCWMAA